ncbi:MAG: cytochrome c [Pirellulaceae bacterium]
MISELASLDGEPLFQLPEAAKAADDAANDGDETLTDEIQDRFFELFGDILTDEVLARWLDRDDSITDVGEPPEALSQLSGKEFDELAKQGQVLFAGKANCVQCHGPTGLGDGLAGNYDDWTNEWLKTPGVDVHDKTTYEVYLDAGALPPREVNPRNLQYGVYRGGGSLTDLYRRVYEGIEGTPMPSSKALSEDEVWAVVAYIKSLPFAIKP